MCPPVDRNAPGSVTAHWERVLRAHPGGHLLPPPAAGTPVAAGTPLPPGGPIGGDRQLEISELFVRADPEERRILDLLCLALVGYSDPGQGVAGGTHLVVRGHHLIRVQSRSSLTGVTAVDVPLNPAAGARWVSIVLVRIRRRPRTSQVTSAIVELAQVLDYAADPLGSDAVARAVLDRLEILTTTTTDVSVSVSGSVDLSAAPDDGDAYVILTAEGVVGTPGAALRAGRRPRVPATVRKDDYVILRIGPPRPRRTTQRSLVDLRRQHALVEIGADPAHLTEEGSYATRVARARQDVRAKKVLLASSSGDLSAAVSACREALGVSDELETFRESLASRITTPAAFWKVDDVIAAVGAAGSTAPEAATALQEGLDARLAQLLGMDAPAPDSELSIPAVTPIVVEVADDLVHHVDSREDGARFLNGLIPRMRARVLADTGVTLPGIRMRGDPNLPPGGVRVRIDEVTVLDAGTPAEARYRVDPLASELTGPPGQEGEQTFIHPLTGETGLWSIRPVPAEATEDGAPVDADEPGDDATTFGVPQYLVHTIELVARSHLTAFLGPAEVDALVTEWIKQHPDLPRSATLEPPARVRLAWVLQSLVADRVPIGDGPTILSAVGAVTAPLPDLRRIVRAALRAQLPGLGDSDRRLPLPGRLEEALLNSTEPDVIGGTHRLHLDLLAWLREADELGPVFTVVTGSLEAREIVAPIARSHHPFVTTLAAEELSR